MIIQGVAAEDLLTYRRLDLQGLPAQGLIAIHGNNESGKSSIGEIVCFALFGRTYSHGPGEQGGIVRWGAPRGAVRLRFALADGTTYEVSREIDPAGHQGVYLFPGGASEPLARGVGAVDQALSRLLGFGYEVYSQSYYLAQRELIAPHPQSPAVRAMAGIAAYEEIGVVLATEAAQLAGTLRTEEAEDARLAAEEAGLSDRDHALGRLVPERQDLLEQTRATRAEMERLDRSTRGLTEAPERLVRAVEALGDLGGDATAAAWRAAVDGLSAGIATCSALATNHSETEAGLAVLRAEVDRLEEDLEEVQGIRHLAAETQARLIGTLGQEGGQEDAPFGLLRERQEVLQALHGISDKGGGGRWVARLFLLLAAVLGGMWYLAAKMPTHEIALAILPLITAQVPDFDTWVRPYLLHATGGALALFALVQAFASRFSGERRRLELSLGEVDWRIQVTREGLDRLAALDRLPLRAAIAGLAEVEDPTLHQALAACAVREPLCLAEGGAVAVLVDSLRVPVARIRTALATIASASADQLQASRARLAATETKLAKVEGEIAEEQKRLDRLGNLRHRREELAPALAAGRRHAARLALGQGLLHQATSEVYARFLERVREHVARLLPRLTNGRYQHLKLDHGLRVQIFSQTKGDFVGLHEASSGTERQILLALRLALCQELSVTAGTGPQFAFLDEPFAFFDEERILGSLGLAEEIAGEVAQIFVVFQHPPEGAEFPLRILCHQGQTELLVPD
jgi:exonuclease SbcC